MTAANVKAKSTNINATKTVASKAKTKAKPKTKARPKTTATDVSVPKIPSVSREMLADLQGQVAAINKAQAVIEYTLTGKIVSANENFLRILGYTLDEIRDQHHSLLADPVFRSAPEYYSLWDRLGRGEASTGQYKYIGKGGKVVGAVEATSAPPASAIAAAAAAAAISAIRRRASCCNGESPAASAAETAARRASSPRPASASAS